MECHVGCGIEDAIAGQDVSGDGEGHVESGSVDFGRLFQDLEAEDFP